MREKDVAKLVELVKVQDETAFEQLYNLYYSQLYTYVLKLVNQNHQDAQEIVQETFCTVWAAIDQLKLPEYFPLWIKRIAHNKAIRMFQKNQNKGAYVDPELLIGVEEERVYHRPHLFSSNLSEKKELEGLISQLPKHFQEILKLYYFDDLSIREIQEKLHLTEGTVKSRIFHARKKLKEVIDAYEEKEDRKMKFYLDAFIPSFIVAILANIKQRLKQSTNGASITQVCAVGLLVVAGTQVAMEIPQLSSHEEKSISNVGFKAVNYRGNRIETADQAYYLLKLIIPDEKSMQNEKIEVLQELRPMVESLLESNTNYQQELKKSNWYLVYKERIM